MIKLMFESSYVVNLYHLLGMSTAVDVKKVIDDVLNSLHSSFTSLSDTGLSDLANHLYECGLINNAIRGNPSMQECIAEFKASLAPIRKLPQIQELCKKFLNSFIAVRGSYAFTAKALHEEWVETIETRLGFKFDIKIDD